MDVTTLSITLEPGTNRKLINGKYRIMRKIGQGQFGKVLLGEVVTEELKRKKDGKGKTTEPRNTSRSRANSRSENHHNDSITTKDSYVAIKTINRIDKTRLITKSYLSQTTKIKREISIMKECNHPNVVRLFQVIDDLKYDKILLILEYCKYGEIDWRRYSHYHEKYKKNQPLKLNKILRDVTDGLEYLHYVKGIVHRDLKPSNLLISEDNTIKISDFGVSLILENNANDEKELGKTMGTPAFFAPELCQFVQWRTSGIKKVDIDRRIDIWLLGVVLYCLIFNALPFNGRNEYDLFKKIVRDELSFPAIKPSRRATQSDLDEMTELKKLIRGLLSKDPNLRPSIEEIKTHPFTTFDLTTPERKEYLAKNRLLFEQQARERAKQPDVATRIKRFFVKEKKKEVHVVRSPTDVHNMETVDDLLDLYLDDLLSLGSLEDDLESRDMFHTGEEESKDLGVSDEGGVKLGASYDVSEAFKNSDDKVQASYDRQAFKNSDDKLGASYDVSEAFNDDKLQASHFSGGVDDVDSNLTGHDVSQVESNNAGDVNHSLSNLPNQHDLNSGDFLTPPQKHRPEPLVLTSTPIELSPMSINKHISPHTPINDNVVVVGDSLPSLIRSIFSPHLRFFARNKSEKKKTVEPTIESLRSPAKKMAPEDVRRKFTDLMEPPPIFGLNVAYPAPEKESTLDGSGLQESAFDSRGKRGSQSSLRKSLESMKRNSLKSETSQKSDAKSLESIRRNSLRSDTRSLELSLKRNSQRSDSILRRNSLSSLRNGLSRITSSLLSLNLNAYLTDDNFLLASTRSIHEPWMSTKFVVGGESRESINRDSRESINRDSRESFNRDSFNRDSFNRDSFNRESINRNSINDQRDSINGLISGRESELDYYASSPQFGIGVDSDADDTFEGEADETFHQDEQNNENATRYQSMNDFLDGISNRKG